MSNSTEKPDSSDDATVGEERDDDVSKKSLDELLEGIAAMLHEGMLRAEREEDESEPPDRIELNEFKIKRTAVKELKKRSNNHLTHVLSESGVLTRRFYVKQLDNDEFLPFSIFILQFMRKVLTCGECIEVTRTGDKLSMTVESFEGVALQVLSEDLEADGYKEVAD